MLTTVCTHLGPTWAAVLMRRFSSYSGGWSSFFHSFCVRCLYTWLHADAGCNRRVRNRATVLWENWDEVACCAGNIWCILQMFSCIMFIGRVWNLWKVYREALLIILHSSPSCISLMVIWKVGFEGVSEVRDLSLSHITKASVKTTANSLARSDSSKVAIYFS